jgi:hypothetical protein
MPHFDRAFRRLLLPFLLVSTPALESAAQGTSVDNANGEQRRAAQKTFEAGDDLYEHGRYNEALTAFRASQTLVASPNSRLMIARCLREAGRRAEAFVEFDATERDAQASGGRYAETAASAAAERDALKTSIAFVIVEADAVPGIEGFRIGDHRYPADQLGKPIPVEVGAVTVTPLVSGEDGRSVTLTAEPGKTHPFQESPAGAGKPTTVVPKQETKPQAQTQTTASVSEDPGAGGLRTAAWISAGVGVVGVAGFAIFGSMANSNYEALEEACPSGQCAPDRQDEIDTGERNQLFANVGLVVGAVGIGAGVTLFVLSSGSDEPAHGRVTLSPGGVSYRGSF